MTEYVATSVARGIIARLQATHERRRISVFSGPPGIGKTTAIDEFARRNVGHVVVVKVAKRNAREVLVLQHTLEALRRLNGSSFHHAPNSLWELRSDLFGAICAWASVDVIAARRGEYDVGSFAHLTVVFDEAQNLSADAIDALRYWNDADRCYAPFPLGVAFIGNSEFSLAPTSAAPSVISAAVADRALYVQSLEYEDVSDDDLELMIQANSDMDFAATAALVRAFRGPRSVRSLRRIADLLDELSLHAGGTTISTNDIGRLLMGQ